MKTFRRLVEELLPEEVSHHHTDLDKEPLGSIHHFTEGSGFSQKNHTGVKTHDGWRKIHDYLHPVGRNLIIHGTLGDKIDTTKASSMGKLHDGLPESGKIQHTFQIAALPPGSKLKQDATEVTPEHTYQKQEDGKWKNHQDGHVVEHYHFSPHVFKLHATLPSKSEKKSVS